MTVVGLDDTDSRERGSCTTYVAARLVRRLRAAGASAECPVLVRLLPGVEHKTRGNAALSVHTDASPAVATETAKELVESHAALGDAGTEPGVVALAGDPADVPDGVVAHAERATTAYVDLDRARELAADAAVATRTWNGGRGLVGALAAVGAWRATAEWTCERLAYRPPWRWGTPRAVDEDSLFAAAERAYPDAWDTVDRGEGATVCVPRTPGPVLYGVRGEDPDTVERVAANVGGETPAFGITVRTNQGTDAHLRDDDAADLVDGRAYRLDGTVAAEPETRAGGHVFVDLQDGPTCAAYEPTKRFRRHVRRLRPGDRVTVCGEYGDGTLNLEKFAVRSLAGTAPASPTCPDCGRSMASAGADQGVRCRSCDTTRSDRPRRLVERELSRGWYEVPPVARRHVARPLVRGGFDAPVHPER